MNEGTFLAQCNGIVNGDKFLREVELALHGHIRASDDYNPLVTGDAPTWVTEGISFADGETVFLDFNVPMDYDKGLDLCGLRLHLEPASTSANTTDMGFTTAQDIHRAGAAVDSTTRTAVAETAVASTGALTREGFLDISGSGYEPGDHIKLTLDANSEGVELILLGIDLVYSGTFAAYNDDDRFRGSGAALS